MEINDKKIILDKDSDYELVCLIDIIVHIKYGEFTIRVKESKPYQIVEIRKSIMLSKGSVKDSKSYGD